MPDHANHGALRRILEHPENQTAFDALVALPGSDLTSLLLGVAAGRADSVTPAEVMRQRDSDRFVAPSIVDAVEIARLELLALETAADRFRPVMLAPLTPFGAHRVLGATPQNNVVTTMRLAEVTADPTNSLALEAAARRKQLLRDDPQSDDTVRLAAAHRVTRAQHFAGPRSFAHFSLLGLVTAGRDRGGHQFEIDALVEQVEVLGAIVHAVTGGALVIKLTAFNESLESLCRDLCETRSSDGVHWTLDTERTHGRGYYRSVCFKLHAAIKGELVELGDGGDVWWTQDLVQNRKERLMIGGLGLERLAMITGNEPVLG